MKKSILFLALGLMMTLSAQAAEKKVYTSYNTSNNTLTYFYDDKYDSRSTVEYFSTISTFRRWADYHSQVKRVVVDASMKNAQLVSMARFFYGGGEAVLNNVTEITGLENLNTATVTNMQEMFYGCSSLTTLDLSSFKTANVVSMSEMFISCYKLTSLNLSSFNTANVVNMNYMFATCKTLKSLDLDNFDVTNVKYMKGMFISCAALETIYCTHDWSKKSSVATADMFTNCAKLKGGMGTTWSEANRQDCYLARLDDPENGKPGYFSEKPCFAPTNLTISNVTQSSATVSWTTGDVAHNHWVLYYRHENASNYTVHHVFKTTVTLSDLRFASKYYIFVASYCSEGNLSEQCPYQTFTTLPKSDYVVVSSCAFKGFDHSAVKYGVTWTSEAAMAIVQAMSPVDANAVYSLAKGGTLYKKNDDGVGYSKVDVNNTIDEGIYTYVTMVNILPPESDDYRFPKSDEGITVTVDVDGEQWNANPKSYNVSSSLSQITMNSPEFTVSAADQQALEDAKETLKETIYSYKQVIEFLNEVGEGAHIVAALNPLVTSAQAVLDDPNATLEDIQNALLELQKAALTYEDEITNILAPYVFEATKKEALEYLDDMVLPDDNEACKKIIEDAKAKVNALTYDSGKSGQDNLDFLDDTLSKLYTQVNADLEAERNKPHSIPQTNHKSQITNYKSIKDGVLYIHHNGQTFTPQGARVK